MRMFKAMSAAATTLEQAPVTSIDVRDFLDLDSLAVQLNQIINHALSGSASTPPELDMSKIIQFDKLKKLAENKDVVDKIKDVFESIDPNSLLAKVPPEFLANAMVQASVCQPVAKQPIVAKPQAQQVKVSDHFEIEDEPSARPNTGIKSQGKSAHR